MFSKALAVTINPAIPGTNAALNATPAGFVSNFYQFALLIAGILALGAIVYGGIRYAASAGNASSQSDAKEWIWGALTGLLLLGGAYIILYLINPNLTNLTLPTLPAVTVVSPAGPGAALDAGVAGSCGSGGFYGTCAGGQTCSQSATGWSCIATGNTTQSADPACRGVTSGCSLYTLTKDAQGNIPANCQGRGASYNSCNNGIPPAGTPSGCYTQHNC